MAGPSGEPVSSRGLQGPCADPRPRSPHPLPGSFSFHLGLSLATLPSTRLSLHVVACGWSPSKNTGWWLNRPTFAFCPGLWVPSLFLQWVVQHQWARLWGTIFCICVPSSTLSPDPHSLLAPSPEWGVWSTRQAEEGWWGKPSAPLTPSWCQVSVKSGQMGREVQGLTGACLPPLAGCPCPSAVV